MENKKYAIGIVVLLLFSFLALTGSPFIGVSKNSMEKDARKSQKIQEDWITAKCVNDDFGAFLFYDEDLSNYTFSIYQNRHGFSFGYFFRSGGSLSGISNNILQINSNGQGNIFLSLNKMQVSRIEIDDGSQKIEEVLIEYTKPFTTIIPENSGEIRFYDVDGKLIPYADIIVDVL